MTTPPRPSDESIEQYLAGELPPEAADGVRVYAEASGTASNYLSLSTLFKTLLSLSAESDVYMFLVSFVEC